MTAAAMSLSLVAPGTAQASTLISVGATGSWTNAPVTALQQWPYKHNFADDPVTATEVVEYPASLGFIGMPMGDSVNEGASGLLRAIASISGRKIITCESQGCLSVTQLLMQFAADAITAPAAGDLIIVMVGNPATAGGGASAQNAGGYEPFFRITFQGATPESQYETVNVTREYDFFADRPLNDPTGLALFNNLVAFLVVHPNYADVDMDAPDNLIKVVGKTTYVLVPTKQLPMLQTLYDAAEAWRLLTGQADLLKEVQALDARLRAIIDQDYDRSGYVPQGSPADDEPAAAMATDTGRTDLPAVTSAPDALPDSDGGQRPELSETPANEEVIAEPTPARQEAEDVETLVSPATDGVSAEQVERVSDEATVDDDAADAADDDSQPSAVKESNDPSSTPRPDAGPESEPRGTDE